MKKHPNEKQARSRNLPKWPQMVVTGTPVTVEQAKEIIRRTDTFFDYAGGNNHAYVRKTLQTLGFAATATSRGPQVISTEGLDKVPFRSIIDTRQDFLEEWGYIPQNYVRNSHISSAFIYGAHGWCHPDGTIGFSHNVGKWPTIDDVIADWERIAAAFPFLEVNVTLMDGESSEDGKGVISFILREGKVTVVADDVYVHENHPSTVLFRSDSDIMDGIWTSRENGIEDSWIEEWALRSRPILDGVRARYYGKQQK